MNNMFVCNSTMDIYWLELWAISEPKYSTTRYYISNTRSFLVLINSTKSLTVKQLKGLITFDTFMTCFLNKLSIEVPIGKCNV